MRVGHEFGPFIFTTVCQGSGAPWIDRAFATTQDGRRFESLCIRHTGKWWCRSTQPEEAWIIGVQTDSWRRLKTRMRPLTWCFGLLAMPFTISSRRRQHQSLTSFGLANAQGFATSLAAPETASLTPLQPKPLNGQEAPRVSES